MLELLSIINQSIMIAIFVFVIMLLVDYFDVITNDKLVKIIKGSKLRQYTIASFLGSTPGCLGAFMNVSLYIHKVIGFGAIVGGMIATSGDESFVMLSMFPLKAMALFVILFILGIVGAWLSDIIIKHFGISTCEKCKLQKIHLTKEKRPFKSFDLYGFRKPSIGRYGLIFLFMAIIILNLTGVWGPQRWSLVDPDRIILLSISIIAIAMIATSSEHYLKKHIIDHILKKHIWKVFLWTFFALLFVKLGLQYWNLGEFVKENMGLVLIISAIIGLIPESGPHMIFVTMFASGIIPFSVLLTSSIVQDGHGMLPLFSYSVRDSLLIKAFNLVFGLFIGAILFFAGF